MCANNIRILEFQQDLKKGLTLDEACRKHKISLDYAFKHMPKKITRSKKRNITKKLGRPPKIKRKNHNISYLPVDEKNITERYGKFFLRKRVQGKERVFGTYKTVEDAVKIRDYCDEHGWHRIRIDEYCNILGVERCKGSRRSKEMFH